MRSRLFATLFGVLMLACSASERANPTPRCKVSSDCESGSVCYRGFCIPFDDPQLGGDDAAMSEPAPLSDAASEPPATVDASSPPAPSGDAARAPALDGSSQTPPPPPSEGGQSVDPGPVQDSAVEPVVDAAAPAQDASTPPEPPADAGSPPAQDAAVVDASSVNVQLELTRCLAICSGAEQLCMTCFRQLVNRNPEICATTGTSGTNVLLRTLCQAYCRSPRCEAP